MSFRRSCAPTGSRPSGRRPFTRASILALAFITLSVVPLVGASSAAEAPDAPAADSAVEASAPAAPAGDIPSLRTRTSRTYSVDDGDREAHIFTEAINYRDAEGAWQPIDNTLVASFRPATRTRTRPTATSSTCRPTSARRRSGSR